MNELKKLIIERQRLIKAGKYDFLIHIQSKIAEIARNFNLSHNLKYNEHDIKRKNNQED